MGNHRQGTGLTTGRGGRGATIRPVLGGKATPTRGERGGVRALAAEWDHSAEFAQHVLLLLTVDSGGKPHLEKLVEELNEHLPEAFEVSGSS